MSKYIIIILLVCFGILVHSFCISGSGWSFTEREKDKETEDCHAFMSFTVYWFTVSKSISYCHKFVILQDEL